MSFSPIGSASTSGSTDGLPDFGQRDALGLDEPPLLHEDGALDRVGQLTDVARPGVGLEQLEDFGREPLHRFLERAAQAPEQVVGQRVDVLPALPQGRQVDAQDVDAVVQVFAEAGLTHERLDVAVGGGDDAHVDLDGLVAAQALEALVLEHAQQLGLQPEAQFAELVQEQRAPVGLLEAAGAGLVRAGEGAFFVAEQLAFEQGLRDVGAVDLDERLLAARAVEVDVARDETSCRCRFRR